MKEVYKAQFICVNISGVLLERINCSCAEFSGTLGGLNFMDLSEISCVVCMIFRFGITRLVTLKGL